MSRDLIYRPSSSRTFLLPVRFRVFTRSLRRLLARAFVILQAVTATRRLPVHRVRRMLTFWTASTPLTLHLAAAVQIFRSSLYRKSRSRPVHLVLTRGCPRVECSTSLQSQVETISMVTFLLMVCQAALSARRRTSRLPD